MGSLTMLCSIWIICFIIPEKAHRGRGWLKKWNKLIKINIFRASGRSFTKTKPKNAQKNSTTTKGKKAGGKYTWNKKCKETKWNKYILTSEPDLIFNEFLTNLGLRTPRLQQSPLGLVWRWSLQKLLLETWSSFAASELTPGTVEASVETLQFPCISSEKICLTTYRPFWHEVTSAMLVSRNNPVGVGLVFYIEALFCSNQFTELQAMWVKHSIFSKLSEYIIDSITHESANVTN